MARRTRLDAGLDKRSSRALAFYDNSKGGGKRSKTAQIPLEASQINLERAETNNRSGIGSGGQRRGRKSAINFKREAKLRLQFSFRLVFLFRFARFCFPGLVSVFRAIFSSPRAVLRPSVMRMEQYFYYYIHVFDLSRRDKSFIAAFDGRLYARQLALCANSTSFASAFSALSASSIQ